MGFYWRVMRCVVGSVVEAKEIHGGGMKRLGHNIMKVSCTEGNVYD